jgi:hypothetical protein
MKLTYIFIQFSDQTLGITTTVSVQAFMAWCLNTVVILALNSWKVAVILCSYPMMFRVSIPGLKAAGA